MNLPQIHEPAVHDPATLPAPNDGGLSVLGVGNDADAVAMWLRARGARSENTARTYARCSDRLLQWCQEREMILAEMSVADADLTLIATIVVARPEVNGLGGNDDVHEDT